MNKDNNCQIPVSPITTTTEMKLTPDHGPEETTVTVVVQAFPSYIPVKLAFNTLLVDTNPIMRNKDHTILMASVPPFSHTNAQTFSVPVSLCFIKNNYVTSCLFVANFIYDTVVRDDSDVMNALYPKSLSVNEQNKSTVVARMEEPGRARRRGPYTPAVSITDYDPYPSLRFRSNLMIVGDTMTMTHDWTQRETQDGRRLVQFVREEEETQAMIRCRFHPATTMESMPTMTTVSCIYWEEKKDYFITSVDCIQLIEFLLKIKFSMEERNRVRRNLEGFRPYTVSKGAAESARFFQKIMGFPKPKPRNIEKDLKVFSWKNLPYALKKIVIKYTMSL
ncbi:hypothetical protein INT47_009738 [Mucor saturninus]|uniref:DUF7082 domain-containing protein n=1 Tax=Mucor saturninus TaxID=64648 RepID=A0A8H7QRD6_9FUNG|nr:hypothetical protein INT47_009738 [Mucor saturninus]